MATERIEVPRTSTSPRVARRFVAGLLGDDSRADDAALLVSELVTNAIQHAGSDAEIAVELDGRRLRVEVTDASPARPALREPTATGGRGLRLVEALADRWGVTTRRGGKVVWFELDPRPA